MLKEIHSTILFMAVSTFAVASSANAQTTPKLADAALPVSSHSIDATIMPKPTGAVQIRKVTRIVEPTPKRSMVRVSQATPSYAGLINAKLPPQNSNTKFVYKGERDNTQTPVYFGESGVKAK